MFEAWSKTTYAEAMQKIAKEAERVPQGSDRHMTMAVAGFRLWQLGPEAQQWQIDCTLAGAGIEIEK